MHGALAVGLSGEDANLITAVARSEALGYVGDVVGVDPVIVHQLLAQGLIPVVATIGTDESGQAFNINADTAAGALAAALEAEKLVFLTDVAGLRADPEDPGTLDPPCERGGPRPHGGHRHRDRRDDPEARGLRPGVARRGPECPPPRRPDRARPAARDLHRRRGGDDGGGRPVSPGPAMSPATGEDRSALMGTYPEPAVTFVRGEGSTLYDTEGNTYLDFLSGLAVTSLGHAHPVVADAIAEQARTLSHVSNLFGTVVGPEVAVTLDRLIGGGTDRAGGQVFFANSGAEANECALKLARRWAGDGRFVVVSTWDAFHGRTLATLAATGQVAKQAGFAPMPDGFEHVPFDDLDAMDAACDPARVAAVLVEPVLGEAGVVVPSSDYLGGLRRLCTERGILLMVDEVQTGLGRTGRWFGFQHLGIDPDVVTMAKALGNGMPVGACWARAEVAAAFVPGDHGSTFGGQPLALSAVRATLAVMEQEDVPARARESGTAPAGRARATARCRIGAGRGSSAGRGPDRGPGRAGLPGGARQGVGVNAPSAEVVRFAPSLLVSDDEIDRAVDILGRVLAGSGADAEPPAARRGSGRVALSGRRDAGADRTVRPGTRHVLEVDDLGPSGVAEVVALAEGAPGDLSEVLDGRGVALLFEKPSNRTRNSSEMAVVALGGHPVSIQGSEVGLDVRETAADVARTLACYHSVIGARVIDHGALERMAAALDGAGVAVPVINLLSDRAHPCQALADLLTLRDCFGADGLGDRTVAYIGDANNVWRSLALAASMSGIPTRVASPAGYGPSAVDVDLVRSFGGDLVVTDDPVEAATGADALYTDVWTSMGQEAERDVRLARLRRFPDRRGTARPAPRTTRWCSTVCPSTAAKRSAQRWSTATGAPSGVRPPTGCTPCGACWRGSAGAEADG